MGLNFAFVSAHGSGYLFNCAYLSWSRRRPPGNGHTAALSEDENWPRELAIGATVEKKLHPVAGHSMAISASFITQSAGAKQISLYSHTCHFLSSDFVFQLSRQYQLPCLQDRKCWDCYRNLTVASIRNHHVACQGQFIHLCFSNLCKICIMWYYPLDIYTIVSQFFRASFQKS